MIFAYVDPPYLGCCRLYAHHHPPGQRPFDGRCWDDLSTHKLLIEWVVSSFPDGFAISCHEPSLRHLLPMTPPTARVGAWGKTFCAFKRGVRPAYAWEPVLYFSKANPPWIKHAPPKKGGRQTTPKDFLAAPISMRAGFTGAKPKAFCEWVLALLNVRPGDRVVDLFPGAGSMSMAAGAIPLRPDVARRRVASHARSVVDRWTVEPGARPDDELSTRWTPWPRRLSLAREA